MEILITGLVKTYVISFERNIYHLQSRSYRSQGHPDLEEVVQFFASSSLDVLSIGPDTGP